MMYWGNGMGTWGVLLMILGNALFWGLIIAGMVMLVRHLSRSEPVASVGRPPTAEQVLAERYARGDIDEDEYMRRMRVLSSAGSGR